MISTYIHSRKALSGKTIVWYIFRSIFSYYASLLFVIVATTTTKNTKREMKIEIPLVLHFSLLFLFISYSTTKITTTLIYLNILFSAPKRPKFVRFFHFFPHIHSNPIIRMFYFNNNQNKNSCSTIILFGVILPHIYHHTHTHIYVPIYFDFSRNVWLMGRWLLALTRFSCLLSHFFFF